MYRAKSEADISVEDVRRLLHYDPDLGILTWKRRDEGTLGWSPGWNGKNAGKVAGTEMKRIKKAETPYLVFRLFDRPVMAHRVAWCWAHGYWPPDQIDHINMIRNDNRLINLRLATLQQNAINRVAQDNNRHGLRGVRLHKSGLYHARITFEGHEHSLGYWKTPEDASRCYGVVSRLLHKEYSRELGGLDLPDDV